MQVLEIEEWRMPLGKGVGIGVSGRELGILGALLDNTINMILISSFLAHRSRHSRLLRFLLHFNALISDISCGGCACLGTGFILYDMTGLRHHIGLGFELHSSSWLRYCCLLIYIGRQRSIDSRYMRVPLLFLLSRVRWVGCAFRRGCPRRSRAKGFTIYVHFHPDTQI